MNKYQEELNHIMNSVEYDFKKSDFKNILKLVNKETPKKVETEPFYQTGDCPCCKSTVGRLDIYCKKCGQKLDWSEKWG